MRRAVELARSGQHGGWGTIKDALLAEGRAEITSLMEIQWKRDWLDLLCREAQPVSAWGADVQSHLLRACG